MSHRHFLTCLLAAIVGCLVLAPGALGATAGQVLNDWREDGSIDGDYKLSELRAADQRINPQEREYTFWDEAYADAVSRINNPDAKPRKRPPTVPPRDFDNDGAIDADDLARANAETARLRAKRRAEALAEARRKKAEEEAEKLRAKERDDDNEPASSKSDDDDDDGLGWLALLLVLVPAAIIGVGVYRMQRARKAGRRDTADMDDTMDGFPPA